MNPGLDPRHISRALALQTLFSELIVSQPSVEPEHMLPELEANTYDPELYRKLVEGVKSSYQLIDPVISALAPAWPIEQIAPVDLTLLRMGIWEAFISNLTPAKVVINEMIELAKQFGGANSGSFINGVLGSLIANPELQTKLVTPQANV